MSKKTVRKIFIFILIFLPLQYILVGIVGYYNAEPWPAFVFPGFKNVYESQDQYLIRQTHFELYNNQREKIGRVQPHHLFPGIPRSQISGLLRTAFKDGQSIQSFSPGAKEFIYENSRRISGQDISRVEVVNEIDFLEDRPGDFEADSTTRQLIGTIHFTE